MKFRPKIAIMSAVHDIRRNKHNSVSPSMLSTQEYSAREFNEYLNKLVSVESLRTRICVIYIGSTSRMVSFGHWLIILIIMEFYLNPFRILLFYQRFIGPEFITTFGTCWRLRQSLEYFRSAAYTEEMSTNWRFAGIIRLPFTRFFCFVDLRPLSYSRWTTP